MPTLENALARYTAAPPDDLAARMADRLRLLHVVTAPSAEPLDVRLRRALALTTTLLGVDLGAVSRVRGDTWTVVAAHSTTLDLAPGDTFPLAETYCALTLEYGDVFGINHMARSAHSGHVCYSMFGMESYIGTPVTVGDAIYGTLCFAGAQPAAFTDADADLIRVLATWTGRLLEQSLKEAELSEQAALVSGLYDASPLMMGVVELAGDCDVLYHSDNAATAARVGTTPEALRGRLASEMGASPDVIARWIEAYRRADATDAPVAFEYTDTDSGSPLRIAAHVARVAAADPLLDRPARFCYVAKDITEARMAQEHLATSERRARVLSEATFEGIAFTRDGVILDANDQFVALFGFASREAVVRTPAVEVVAPEFIDLVRTMIRENRPEAYEAQLVRQDGSRFWAEIQGTVCPYVDGADIRVTAIRDISRRKEAELQIRFQANVLAHVSDAVVALDLDGRVTYWNAGAERLHGLPAETVMGRPLHTVVRYHVPEPDGPPGAAPAAADASEALREAAGRLGDLFYEGPAGGRRVVSVSASLIRTDAGDERGVLAVLRDVTAERELSAQMRHQALHDALTGLPNRTQFRQRVERAVHGGVPFAVLYLDLDRFKGVNDTLGHDAGDRLLVAVGGRMRAAVGPGGLVARLGGDEFGVVVPGTAAEALRLAERLLAAIRRPVSAGARTVVPAASVGVVGEAGRYDDPEALLRDADTAMYESKRTGRARVSVFDDAMREAVVRRFGLEHDLRQALAEDQLRIRLQPIVDLETGAVVGFESLVRWEHPTRGLLGPVDFIPVAEEIGLVAEIDAFVLEATCREVGAWSAAEQDALAGLAMVNVNCSDQTFVEAGLAARARAAAEAAGLRPDMLTLELTERALVAPDAARSAVDEIRAHGLKLCIDDFGSGYSSLGLLHRLPVDGLKIDRSFITDLDTSPAAQAVVRAVVQFSADLGLRAVAEGIETPGQLRRLRAMGCRYGQGYLFSPPVAPDVARALLAAAPWTDRWEEEEFGV